MKVLRSALGWCPRGWNDGARGRCHLGRLADHTTLRELASPRATRFGHAEPLDLLGDDLLGSLELIQRDLAVVVEVEDAEDRVRRLGERLVELSLTERAVPVGIRGLERHLHRRPCG